MVFSIIVRKKQEKFELRIFGIWPRRYAREP
jgi:hypothetical protein